jgi:hypothetical protein
MKRRRPTARRSGPEPAELILPGMLVELRIPSPKGIAKEVRRDGSITVWWPEWRRMTQHRPNQLLVLGYGETRRSNEYSA